MKTLLILLSLFASISLARLKPTTLKSFLSESEIILEATPQKSEWTELGAGSAELRVNRVLRGEYTKPTISISWTAETHNQSIDNMSTDWLLFLKKDEMGQLVASQYGRSYWRLNSRTLNLEKARPHLDSDSRGVFYQHPLNQVTFSTAEKKKWMTQSQDQCDRKSDFVSMKAIKNMIDEIKPK